MAKAEDTDGSLVKRDIASNWRGRKGIAVRNSNKLGGEWAG